MVEYSFSVDDGDFIPLRRGKNIERSTFKGYPSFYIPRGKQILINPIPEGSYGRIRINYTESTPTLDKRRGVIDVVTLDPLTRTITAERKLLGADHDFGIGERACPPMLMNSPPA